MHLALMSSVMDLRTEDASGERGNKMQAHRRRGFTLIELLIVVAIIGIIASILIPNLIDALHKAKQKRTVAEMRNVGTAWMAWLTDQVGAASAGTSLYDASSLSDVSYDELDGYLIPNGDFFYASEITRTDAGGSDFLFCLNSNLGHNNVMMVCSPGRNGTYGENPTSVAACCGGGVIWTAGGFIATDYDQDLVWADGQFIRYPSGVN